MRAILRLLSSVLILVTVLVSGDAYALSVASPVPIGPEGGWITALAVSPAFDADGRAWTATFGGHIFSATNAAGSWTQSHAGETDPVVEALAASPDFTADATVFAAADEGVFRSTDGGASWGLTSAGLGHHFCRAVVTSTSYASDHTVFVATDAGVYRSNDGGSSWSPPVDDTRSAISLAEVSSGAGPETLFAGLDAGGLEQSSDGGRHWQSVPNFPAGKRALAIILMPDTTSFTPVVATDDGIWRLGVAESVWRQVGASGDRIDALAAGRSTTSVSPLFAGSAGGHGVYVSVDAGATWAHAGSPTVPFVTTLVSAGASTLLAGTTGGGISESTDGGQSWRNSSSGLRAFQVGALSGAGASVVAAGNGGAFVRDVGGSRWRPLALPSHFVTSVTAGGDELFAGTQDMGLLVSHDAGSTWSRTSLLISTVSQIALSPQSGTTMFVAGDYVYRSSDAGSTFEATALAGNDVRTFAFSPAFESDRTAFAGTLNHGVYRTADGGTSWLPDSTGLPSVPVMSVLTSRNFADDETVYAATAGNGIYVSSNGGANWTALTPALPASVVDALAWTEAGELVAGTDRGVYLLEPSGWSALSTGWDVYVSALQDVVVAGSEFLYVGTTGQGVWVATLVAASPAATATAPAISTTAPTVTPSLDPTTVKSATPKPTAPPKPTPSVRPLALRLRVDPVPVVAHQAALLTARGPAGGQVQLRLQAGTWQRIFLGALGKDGRVAFGFVCPPAQIAVTGVLTAHGHTASSKMLIPVSSP